MSRLVETGGDEVNGQHSVHITCSKIRQVHVGGHIGVDQLVDWNDAFVVAACKLSLALARVLSIAARAHAKNLHALWPIGAPTVRLRQSERHTPAAPIRARELSSRLTGQRRFLTHVGA